MNTIEAILQAMEAILGLEQSEMQQNLDLDLFDSGLVDSLAMVSLLTEVEEHIGRAITIKDMNPDCFLSVNRLAGAIDGQGM